MRNLNYLNKYRIDLYRTGIMGDEYNGAFLIPKEKHQYFIIASNGYGWEHVSVSLRTNAGTILSRTPKWAEMCEVKEMFFEPNEVVMQLHPSDDEYIEEHPYVLHLWRPLEKEIPTPPSYMVGYKKKVKQKG